MCISLRGRGRGAIGVDGGGREQKSKSGLRVQYIILLRTGWVLGGSSGDV